MLFLKSFDLSSFNKNNAIDMTGMFYNCFSLKSIFLRPFYSDNVNNMDLISYASSSLQYSFNIQNVEDMSEIVGDCESLKSIVLSSFNTNNDNKIEYK